MTPTVKSPSARMAALTAVALWAVLAADALAQNGAASDRAALEALYDATGGEDWTDSTRLEVVGAAALRSARYKGNIARYKGNIDVYGWFE